MIQNFISRSRSKQNKTVDQVIMGKKRMNFSLILTAKITVPFGECVPNYMEVGYA